MSRLLCLSFSLAFVFAGCSYFLFSKNLTLPYRWRSPYHRTLPSSTVATSLSGASSYQCNLRSRLLVSVSSAIRHFEPYSCTLPSSSLVSSSFALLLRRFFMTVYNGHRVVPLLSLTSHFPFLFNLPTLTPSSLLVVSPWLLCFCLVQFVGLYSLCLSDDCPDRMAFVLSLCLAVRHGHRGSPNPNSSSTTHLLLRHGLVSCPLFWFASVRWLLCVD